MKQHIISLTLLAAVSAPALAQTDTVPTAGRDFRQQVIAVGANKNFTREQSTAAVTVVQNADVNKRGAKNVANSIIGQAGNGLVSLQNSGTYFEANPTFYVRGLQSLSTSTPLILVDGIERDINMLDPLEVDQVQVLKDAAAVALYGTKGANGAVLITTKRGKYNSKEIKVTYDHLFNWQVNKPTFVNAPTYAAAMNQALANEGLPAKYTSQEVAAFASGQYPDLYPNVNWTDQAFRNSGVTNKIGVEFTGGGEKFRYYTMLNLLSDKGFIANNQDDNGNNTQDKYVRGNMRINFDAELTPTTQMSVNVAGVLSEMSRPGNSTNLWSLMYTVPSAAFPVKFANGDWGGSSTWEGTNNPLANTMGAAYTKINERALNSDLTINQSLASVTEGLSATARVGFDTFATINEDHSKTYLYGFYAPATWGADGVPVPGKYTQGGAVGTQGTGANTNLYNRRFHFDAGVNYDRTFAQKHYVYSSLRWEYEYNDYENINTTVYRQNLSWLGHYAYNDRYIAEVALLYTGSSRLAPGTKWNFAPTGSLAWVASKEKFMQSAKWVDFLKLRASYGRINCDYLPGDNVWTYYTQSYTTDGVTYPFNSKYDSAFGRTNLGQMATVDPSFEKADKFNVGFDATFFKNLNVQFDYYYQQRKDIFVSGASKYGTVIGFEAPYINQGKVNSWGWEGAVDWTKYAGGGVTVNIGATIAVNKNEIKDQAEEPHAYDNLRRTGDPLSSIYGMQAVGLFQQSDFNADGTLKAGIPAHNLGTVRPGDIRYADVNGDGVVDTNDQVRLGRSNIAPEVYYTFHFGFDWQGFGINAMFQGVARYSSMLNTNGYFWGLVGNSNLSQYVYDNSWTPDNTDALFPRLSSSANSNNYRASSFWLRNRGFCKLRNLEVYYNLPQCLLEKTGFIKGAKVYMQGIDLFTITRMHDVNPETPTSQIPLTRSVLLGAQITF